MTNAAPLLKVGGATVSIAGRQPVINGRQQAGRVIVLEGMVIALAKIVLTPLAPDARKAALQAITEAVSDASCAERWRVNGHEEAAAHAEHHCAGLVDVITAALNAPAAAPAPHD